VKVVTTVREARQTRAQQAAAGGSVALVPTMGNLHEGHLSLVRLARSRACVVWVSVFVNPTQFGPGEDFERYPRTLEEDTRLLEAEQVDVVFAPSVAEMYPEDPGVRIVFPGLDEVLCGASRPGHFAGVGLVVSKLFNIVAPTLAVFGQKDAQQAVLIRRLTADLNFDIHIEVAPTVREPDGLAMSSRNAYLSPAERSAAPVLYRALCRAAEAIRGGEQSPRAVQQLLRETIAAQPLVTLEYAECVSPRSLETPTAISGPVLLLVAARLGTTRLIDNLEVTP